MTKKDIRKAHGKAKKEADARVLNVAKILGKDVKDVTLEDIENVEAKCSEELANDSYDSDDTLSPCQN